MSKQILMLSQYFYPHLGGVEKHVFHTAAALQDKGYEVKIVAGRHRGRQPSLPAVVKHKLSELEVVHIRYPRLKFLGLLLIWLQLLKKINLIKQADVIHVHDVFIWYWPFKLVFPQKKIVTTMHGWEGVYPIPAKNVRLKQLAAKLSDNVVCVGEYIEKYYQVQADAVIYGGVDEDWLVDSKQLAAKHQLEPRGLVRLVYVGRLANDTGLPILLSALDSLDEDWQKQLEVKFIGGGELRAEAARYGQVLGWINEPSLQHELAQAQICFTGGYLSALEAMAAGCVVISGFDQQLKQDYWQLGEIGQRVKAGGQIILSQTLRQYWQQRRAMIAQVKFNYAWVKQLSWEQVAQEYEQLYGLKD